MKRIFNAILFSIIFIGIGYLVPFAVYTLTPANNYFEIIKYAPEDIIQGTNRQEIIYDRQVSKELVGEWVSELYLVRVDGGETQQFTQKGINIYETRDSTRPLIVVVDIDPTLEVGKYYYRTSIEFDVGRGVKQTISFTSETFYILEE